MVSGPVRSVVEQMDRGDRVSIQGDGHPTMAAALSAFGRGAFPLVARMLNATDSAAHRVVDDTIMAYPIYWTMSVNDYWWASGDNATFLALVPSVCKILDDAAATLAKPQPPPLVWMGWDDRLGNGWCGTCNAEAQLAFATLLTRAHGDFSKALTHAGLDALSSIYAARASNLTRAVRAAPSWPHAFGLHAAANAINAGVATAAEATALFGRVFNDTTALCSWSPFNQYWNLQAIGNIAGLMDYALASVRLCWGTQLRITSGCFLELWSPEWAEAFPPGAKMPTRPSYCHPWSSGVTHWLSEAHAGLRPLAPGFALALAAPHVSPANPHVGGSRDTPHGALRLEASLLLHGKDGRTDGRTGGRAGCSVSIELDTPVPTLVALPASRPPHAAHGDRRGDDGDGGDGGGACRLVGFRAAHSDDALDPPRRRAQVQASLEWAASHGVGQLHADVAASLGYSRVLPAGRHALEAVYDGAACTPPPPRSLAAAEKPVPAEPTAPFAPFGRAQWKARGVFDRETRGDWVSNGTLGRAGYVLFGFDNGSDVVRLPKWCVNVTANRHGYPSVRPLARRYHGTSGDNATFLQPPPGHAPGTPRALGSVGDECADGCQGSVLDVNLSRVGKRVVISLYLVAVSPQADGPGHATQLAIRAMDLRTLSPIAPLPVVSDFEAGVLWRLEYDRGVRLRLMPIYGGATVSAVFLDE